MKTNKSTFFGMMLLAVTMLFAAGCTKTEEIQASGTYNGHDYVDLGLPSGTLWATCNVGASSPEDFGDYFAWGETQPKDTYSWENYKYCNGDYDQLTKYCNNINYGFDGFKDYLVVLDMCDDVATTNWGNGWRIPTKEQWEELIDNTSCIWTRWNGVKGQLFTASNGKQVFLPAAGKHDGSSYLESYKRGYYWSSTLDENKWNGDHPWKAWCFINNSKECYMNGNGLRKEGFSVRPVCSLVWNK